nr:hypothetical protein [Lachnospiraceae bacterium]
TIYVSPEYGVGPDMRMDRGASETLYHPSEGNTPGGIYHTGDVSQPEDRASAAVYEVVDHHTDEDVSEPEGKASAAVYEMVDHHTDEDVSEPEGKASAAVYEVVDHHTDEDVSEPEDRASAAVYEVVDHHTDEDVSQPEDRASAAVYEVVDHHTEEDVSAVEEAAVSSVYGTVDLSSQEQGRTPDITRSGPGVTNQAGAGEPPIPPDANIPIGGGNGPVPPSTQFESGSSTAVKVITAIVFLALIALSIFAALFLSKKFMVAQKGDQQYDAKSDDPWADILGGDDDEKEAKDQSRQEKEEKEKKEEKEEKTEKGNEEKKKDSSAGSGKDEAIEDYDFGKDRKAQEQPQEDTQSDPFSKDTEKLYENHSASEFAGKEYYEEFVDCIDESLSYKVKRKYAKKLDPEQRIGITTSYVQLDGDIPNIHKINEQLASYGEYYINYYEENESEILDYLKYYGNMNCLAQTVCHVTYTDEDMMSVIFEDQTDVLGTNGVFVTSVNINLKTGTILDNGQILDLPDDFGKTFRERSIKQNGDSPGTDLFSDEQIMLLLDDTSSLIVFYTPVGLEVGYEYKKGQNSGWLTISLRDYQQYLKGL